MKPRLLFNVHVYFLGVLVKIQILISNEMPPGCSDNPGIGVIPESCDGQNNSLPEMVTT